MIAGWCGPVTRIPGGGRTAFGATGPRDETALVG